MTARNTREQETRVAHERPQQWVNPKTLLDPDHREGVTHRWVRTETLGSKDARNVSMRFREGWQPCPADEYPEYASFANESSGNIEYGGLILCRMSDDMVAQRTAYFAKIATNQITAVDQHLFRGNDPVNSAGMRILPPDRKTREQFGSET